MKIVVRQDRWTLWALTGSYFSIAFLSAVGSVSDVPVDPAHFLIGLAVFVIGSSLRIWATASLGDFHSPYVQIVEDQTFVRMGAYRFFRNPYYIGILLEVPGIALMSGSLKAVSLSIIVWMPLVILRAFRESVFLRENLPGYSRFSPSYRR